jgi:chromosome segregation ATPase
MIGPDPIAQVIALQTDTRRLQGVIAEREERIRDIRDERDALLEALFETHQETLELDRSIAGFQQEMGATQTLLAQRTTNWEQERRAHDDTLIELRGTRGHLIRLQEGYDQLYAERRTQASTLLESAEMIHTLRRERDTAMLDRDIAEGRLGKIDVERAIPSSASATSRVRPRAGSNDDTSDDAGSRFMVVRRPRQE